MLVDSKVVRKNKFVKSNNKFHIISYGCQMNFADSEVVASILEDIGYNHTDNIENSNLILLNTCSIREKAEQTIRKKLSSINFLKKKNKSLKIGVLGCMAERLKEKFLHEEKIVDLVVGPDAYRDLPNLLKEVELGNDAVNVLLSKDETYADALEFMLHLDVWMTIWDSEYDEKKPQLNDTFTFDNDINFPKSSVENLLLDLASLSE